MNEYKIDEHVDHSEGGQDEPQSRFVSSLHHEERLRYMQLTSKDIEAIRSLQPVLKPRLMEIVDQFYEFIVPFPATSVYFQQPGLVTRLKKSQYDYFDTLLKGSFDDEYISTRKMIGKTHERVGLEPRWYIGGYALFVQIIFPMIQQHYRDQLEKAEQARMALLKAFFLDMQIAMETYIDRYAEELVVAHRTLEQKLWMEDRLLSFILTEASDAIVGLDEEGRIATWSQGAQRIFGYKTGEMLDKSLKDLIEKSEILDQVNRTIQEKGSTILYGSEWRTKDGSLITADASITALLDENGIHAGSTLVLRDVTEIRRLAGKVKHMEQLAAMTRVTASVAHEIRTPLGVMALTGDLLSERIEEAFDELKNPKADSYRQELLDMVNDLQLEVDRLNEIVDHYLVLSRIRRPNRSRQNLGTFLKDIRDEIAGKCANQEIVLSLHTDEQDVCVEMDPDHIRRVFLNLFDNSKHAIKSKGEISIQSQVEDGQVHIQFRDTGSGIPQEYLDKLFTAFVTNKPGGTGLGLYLVREIIEAHDGRVSIESGVNQGTIIHIFLPMASIEVKQHGKHS
jgi:PAS domain S-box-containing protein